MWHPTLFLPSTGFPTFNRENVYILNANGTEKPLSDKNLRLHNTFARKQKRLYRPSWIHFLFRLVEFLIIYITIQIISLPVRSMQALQFPASQARQLPTSQFTMAPATVPMLDDLIVTFDGHPVQPALAIFLND